MKFKVITFTILFFLPALVFGQALDRAHFGIVNPLEYGAVCDDITLNAALTEIGSDEATLFLPTVDRDKQACTWNINANVLIPENVALMVPKGAGFNINGTSLLAIKGDIIAGDYVIFNYSLGTGARVQLYPTNLDENDITGGREVSIDWFGAIPRDGIDDAHAFDKADDAFNDPLGAIHQGVGLIRIPATPRVYTVASDVVLERTTPYGLADRGVIQLDCVACTFAVDTIDGIPGLGYEMHINNLTFRVGSAFSGLRVAGTPVLLLDNETGPFNVTELRIHTTPGDVALEMAGGRGSRITNNQFFVGTDVTGILNSGCGGCLIAGNTFRSPGSTNSIGVDIVDGVQDTYVAGTNIFDSTVQTVRYDETLSRVFVGSRETYTELAWDPPLIAADGTTTTSTDVLGALIGDAVIISTIEAVNNKARLFGKVVIQNEVEIGIHNMTGGNLDIGLTNFRIFIKKRTAIN